MTTTNPFVLHRYVNGNVSVSLLSDGTKIREYEGAPSPTHPESIDMKITNWCDAGCPYCHESSTTRGADADCYTIDAMVEGLPPGVEIAIGGGDPLSHRSIRQITDKMKRRGLVPNITVNGFHIARHSELIKELRANGSVYGVGVSYVQGMEIDSVFDKNTVVHFIAGEHSPFSAMEIMRHHPKILVLGYKNYGRGAARYSRRTEHMLGVWRYWIPSIMRQGCVCFDNLALSQLRIKDRIPAEKWERCYMGGDGTFTMYADAVKGQYAISSTSQREGMGGRTAAEYFRSISARSPIVPQPYTN